MQAQRPCAARHRINPPPCGKHGVHSRAFSASRQRPKMPIGPIGFSGDLLHDCLHGLAQRKRQLLAVANAQKNLREPFVAQQFDSQLAIE